MNYLLALFTSVALLSTAAAETAEAQVEVKVIASDSNKTISKNQHTDSKQTGSKQTGFEQLNAHEVKNEVKNEVTVGQWNFSLSLGYGQVESLITGVDDFDLYLLPSISYYGEKFFLENTTLGYSLLETDTLYLDLIGRLNDDGIYFKLDDFGIFSALGIPPPGRDPRSPQPEDVDRKLSYLAGLELTYQLAGFELRSGYYQDISSVHNGYEIDLSVASNFNLTDRWQLYLAATAIHKSKKLLNYYYGLTTDEGVISFFTYLPDSAGTNYYLTLSSEYAINENWSWQGFVKRNYLADEIQNSLIIERKHIDTYFVGIKYRF